MRLLCSLALLLKGTMSGNRCPQISNLNIEARRLLALSVPDYRRRLIGRLRPAVTSWHYPRRNRIS